MSETKNIFAIWENETEKEPKQDSRWKSTRISETKK